jgi:hypothetical protein
MRPKADCLQGSSATVPAASPVHSRLGSLGGRSLANGLACVAILALSGCRVRALVPNENDPLRERIRTLEAEVQSLTAANQELRQSIERISVASQPNSNAGTTWTVTPDVIANAPIAVRLVGTMGSAIVDTPGGPTTLTIQIEPRDGRDRFVQITGWVEITIAAFVDAPAEPAGGSSVLAKQTFGPAEVRDSLRAGLFGVHYSFSTDLPAEVARSTRTVIARVVYRDGFTGRTMETLVPCSLQASKPT